MWQTVVMAQWKIEKVLRRRRKMAFARRLSLLIAASISVST